MSSVFYSVLENIGPAADDAKYKYKLEFSNKGRREDLPITLLAGGFDEYLSEVHNSGNCVKLYPEQYNRSANDRNKLAFSLDIFEV
jgi:hypothetical protein